MTTFAIDLATALRLAREGVAVPPPEHQLVAPARLRSDVLSWLYRATRRGELSASEGRRLLDRVTTTKVRLLADRVSRATAWKIADQLGSDDTPAAEYIAVATLQADLFVTDDAALTTAAASVVPTIGVDELVRLVGTAS
jgi:predicted nucleic acid-binding protein